MERSLMKIQAYLVYRWSFVLLLLSLPKLQQNHNHFNKCNRLRKWEALKLAHLFGIGTTPGIYYPLDFLGESSVTSLIL